jgi:integrase
LADADVQTFVNERSATGKKTGVWGPRRVEMMANLLRAAFNLGMRRRPPLIGWNPLGKHGAVVLPEVRQQKARPLSHAQAMALLDQIKDHDHEHLYWVLLATGLRVGEALGLQWSDVDWQRRRLRVENALDPLKGRQWSLEAPKTDAGVRVIPLVEDAVAALQAQFDRKIRRLEPDFIFVDAFGEPYTQDSVRNHMVHVGRKAGIRRTGPKSNITPHDLRRSAATFLHGQGVPLATIQVILGHTSINTTLRYIDGASEDMLAQAERAMTQAFAKMRATQRP